MAAGLYILKLVIIIITIACFNEGQRMKGNSRRSPQSNWRVKKDSLKIDSIKYETAKRD